MVRRDFLAELSPVARRDLRDNWESIKGGMEKALSEVLGCPWTLDVSYNTVLAYEKINFSQDYSSKAKKRRAHPGTTIAEFFQVAIDRLKSYIDRNGVLGKNSVNDICAAHALILTVNIAPSLLCNGCTVTLDGKLAVFLDAGKSDIAINIDDSLKLARRDFVKELSRAARWDMRSNWKSIQENIARALSQSLGCTWTLSVQYNPVLAYMSDRRPYIYKNCPGTSIAECFQAAIDRLQSYIDRNGVDGMKDINNVCTAHVLILETSFKPDPLRNGCAVTSDGKLAIFFNANDIAVDIDDCIREGKLKKAFEDAPEPYNDHV